MPLVVNVRRKARAVVSIDRFNIQGYARLLNSLWDLQQRLGPLALVRYNYYAHLKDASVTNGFIDLDTFNAHFLFILGRLVYKTLM